MAETIKQSIGYVLSPLHNKPIDVRYSIPSLSKQIPEKNRYIGLIFMTEDNKQLYIYETLTKPVLFSEYVAKNLVNGMEITDYSEIKEMMDANGNKTVGSLFTVFPLGVSFVYNGLGWNYHSGIYNVTSDAQFLTIDKTLRQDKQLVIVGASTRKIILADGTLSSEIMVLTDGATLISNRFYSSRGCLYYCINGSLFNVGSKELLLKNIDINVGINKINHKLNSDRVTLMIVSDKHVLTITPEVIDANNIQFESYVEIKKAELLIKTL